MPVDHDPIPPTVAKFFERTKAAPIAMSRFGQAKFEEVGIQAMYVPHGVDTEMFVPVPQDRCRDALKIDPDTFVVGMVANNQGANPSRKAFPQVFEAFAEFHRRHPDSLLYLHTRMRNPDGLDLHALADVTGVPQDAIRFTSEYDLHIGIESNMMPTFYGAFDVLANPSYGEGFGIPIIEAQSCGVPAIVNNCTAMTELAGPAQWLTTNERQSTTSRRARGGRRRTFIRSSIGWRPRSSAAATRACGRLAASSRSSTTRGR